MTQLLITEHNVRTGSGVIQWVSLKYSLSTKKLGDGRYLILLLSSFTMRN